MVEWYHPWRLLTTGFQVIVWDFVGQDRSMEESPRSFRTHRFGKDEVWFDYAADVGDGWNPTFAIASLIAQPNLDVAGRRLPHGEFLLLGGDAVYPVPSQREYRDRFVGPYEAALPATSNDLTRTLLAIPGNHDWYDGLVSFTRQFTQYRRMGGWRTIQEQSYFAIRLPQRWWLWAMDVRAGSYMDHGQWTYFSNAARALQTNDPVILTRAEPDWVTLTPHDLDESHFATVERELITPRGANVHLWLAGDHHHYRRHELRTPSGLTDRNFQRITSGGGGAFLFPTHRPIRRNVVVGDREYVQKTRFPSAVTSFRLSWLNVFFAARNWKLGVFPLGVLYWLLTFVPRPPGSPAPSTLLAFFDSPGLLLWLFVILIGFGIFADSGNRWFRWVGGLTHGVAHVMTAVMVTGAVNAAFLTGAVSISDRVAAHVLNFAAGVVLGPTILGIYLLVALNVFGQHGLGAFSSLRIENYKHFLRLHIDRDGRLEIFPIAIRRVPRGTEGRASYHLIEGPVVIRPDAAQKTSAAQAPAVDVEVRT